LSRGEEDKREGDEHAKLRAKHFAFLLLLERWPRVPVIEDAPDLIQGAAFKTKAQRAAQNKAFRRKKTGEATVQGRLPAIQIPVAP
jgi:hypothetical protein